MQFRHWFSLGLIVLCFGLGTGRLSAVEVATTLPAGVALIKGLDSPWMLGQGTWGNLSMVTEEGKSLVRVETLKSPKYPWDMALAFKTDSAVKKGDILYAEITARGWGPDRPEAFSEIVFETSPGRKYEKTAPVNLTLTREWRTIKLPLVCPNDYPPGGAQLNLRFGYLPQTVEIKDLQLRNYGTQVQIADLPHTDHTYDGRELSAAWRAAADARIEQLRKGDLEIRVVDATGQPLPNATVTVEMQRHAFRFGASVTAGQFMGKSEDSQRYRKEMARLFNSSSPGLELKWDGWEKNRTQSLELLDFLRAQGLAVRGHNLVWPRWRYLPARLKLGYEERLADPKEGEVKAKAWLRTEVMNHIRDEATACQGKVADWDVVNEAMDNDDLMKLLGPELVGACFSAARQADPKATLVLNEYDVLEGDGANAVREQRVLGWINEIRKAGGPIDALGLQCHFGYSATGPVKVLDILDRLHRESKLPIQITEFDMNVTDERLQADYTRDLLTAAFSSPAVTGFSMWGFWAGDHWLPDAAMYRKDWTPRPSLQEYENLVLKRWWTNTTGTTDATGTYRIRGFLGDYRVQVNVAQGNTEAKMEAKTALKKTGTVLQFELK
ncbi:MAG: endo-1,4-beta-xylanase [Phycisphaerae bacterium]